MLASRAVQVIGTSMKIFISYRSLDRTLVDTLSHDLDRLGHNVWFDKELTGGQEWWDTICAAIRDCDVFVIALTPGWLDSFPSWLEFEYATACKRIVLPIKLSTVEMNQLPPEIAKLQIVTYVQPTRQDALNLGRVFV